MNWSIFSITLIDNVNSFFSLLELILGIVYFIIAFLNLLVDTSETFGILLLVTFILLHQFNLLVYVHSLSSTSESYNNGNGLSKLSLYKLYLSTFLLVAMYKPILK